MKKELSKREQKRQEKITKENIQKFDEEYKKSRIIPEDYKKKIRNRILKNTIIAIIVIAYLILLNVLSLYIETKTYILSIKILCVTLAVISVVYFELSYRKDNGYLFMHGVEFLVIATITLFSVYAYSIFYITYNSILLYISIFVVIYYVIKTILTLKNMRNQYYKEQNDIKEIVKKQVKGENKND